MSELAAWFVGVGFTLVPACVCWLISLRGHDVSIVDRLWPLLFIAAAGCYAGLAPVGVARLWLVLALVSLWGLRLSAYITWRNWGAGEDRRYQSIRQRNNPGFARKSLYLVFALQALLAWVISLPLLGAIFSTRPLNITDLLGTGLWAAGFLIESTADWQLSRFRATPHSQGQVMDRGLWRYSRHPNYFGECCVWWGLYLLALAAGAWWAIVGPALLTLMLLRVSGVVLLEKDIAGRRPAYREYIQRTSAFVPWPPRVAALEPQP